MGRSVPVEEVLARWRSNPRVAGSALGDAVSGPLPRIYLYDPCPGGAGLSEKLYEKRRALVGAAARLVASCRCQLGCPACVGALAAAGGPPGRAKQAAAALLHTLAEEVER